MKLNLPNKLTLFRIICVPVYLVITVAIDWGNDSLARIISASFFVLISLTDTLDGYIARKYNMITNFGKFLDPLADKFIVFAGLLAVLVQYPYLSKIFVWAAAIVMFRELAVTSMRLIVAKHNIVVAASWLGKIKTWAQIVCVVAITVEPVLFPFFAENHILSYFTMGAMTLMTLWSGIDYFVKYGKYITQED